MRSSLLLSILTTTLLLPVCVVMGEREDTPEDVKTVSSITVAIIEFESQAPGNPDLGRQLGDILTARLSVYDQFQLVERKKLEDLLREQQLTLAGMVDTDQAIKVGKMAGARIMVFGRAFAVDRDLYIVAKIVGTETSQVKGVIARGKLESNLSEIIDELVDKLAGGLEKWAPQLLPKTEKFQNKLKTLKRQLKGKNLPTVAVVVQEAHVNLAVADPAAETEIKKTFEEVGFEVIEARDEITRTAAKEFNMAGVDLVITGQGFSEFGMRIGGLVGCVARLEIQATERESHGIVTSERTTRRAVDLSEAVAAKTALQAAGRELAIKTIERLARELAGREESENK